MEPLLAACRLQEAPAAPGLRHTGSRSAGQPVSRSAGQPVSPQAAASRLLSARDAALRAREEALRSQRRRIQEGTIDHLPDKFAVRTLLTDVIDSCRSEVLVSKHGGSFPVAALREALPRDLALLERGTRMRSLYQHATRFDQPTRTHAEQLVAGAQIRTLPKSSPRCSRPAPAAH